MGFQIALNNSEFSSVPSKLGTIFFKETYCQSVMCPQFFTEANCKSKMFLRSLIANRICVLGEQIIQTLHLIQSPPPHVFGFVTCPPSLSKLVSSFFYFIPPTDTNSLITRQNLSKFKIFLDSFTHCGPALKRAMKSRRLTFSLSVMLQVDLLDRFLVFLITLWVHVSL